jgi:hypothetical protein
VIFCKKSIGFINEKKLISIMLCLKKLSSLRLKFKIVLLSRCKVFK